MSTKEKAPGSFSRTAQGAKRTTVTPFKSGDPLIQFLPFRVKPVNLFPCILSHIQGSYIAVSGIATHTQRLHMRDEYAREDVATVCLANLASASRPARASEGVTE